MTVANMVDTGINQNYIGYAFLVNGTFFVGNSGVSNQVLYEINPTTGAVSPVNFTLNLPGSTSFYITNTVYDPNLDQLYIFNGNGTLYSLSNASVAPGVPETAATPEPGTLTLLGISLALMFAARRRNPPA